MYKNSKKTGRFFNVFVSLLLFICVCGLLCIASAESSPSLVLNMNELTIAKGRSSRITATLTDAKAKLVWESADPSIAAVVSGTVTGKSAGKTTVKCSATLSDGTVLSASCDVAVFTPIQSMKAIQSITIDIGQESEPIAITFTPADASYQSVTWASDDESIASVNENGVITGKAAGTCKITGTTTEPVQGNAKAKVVTCKVTVYCPVTSIDLECQETTVLKGKTLKINPVIHPDDATNKKLTWESSDPAIATVLNGNVTAKASGDVTIKCYVTNQTGEIIASEYGLSVQAPVLSIAPESKQNIVLVGSTSEPLQLKFQPADATFKEVTWSVKDESIATVDTTGRITGIKAGKTSIIVTSTDPLATGTPKSCTIPISVNQGAQGLTITGDETIAKGKQAKLTWTVSPEDTTNKKLEWTSSNEKVARVSNGYVTAVGVGKCTITGKTTDGTNITATHSLTVIQAVTSIQPKKSGRIVVTEGNKTSIQVNVLPKDATNKKLKWSSDSSYIASVDSNGYVTGQHAGTCNITASATDGSGRKVKIAVVVEPKIPLDAVQFTRSGYFGAYYEFAIDFKNLTKTRTITYIEFDLKYNYLGSIQTYSGFYDDRIYLGPNNKKRTWWWDQIGYRLTYCSDFRVYLRYVEYSDGTWDSFAKDDVLLGWF